MAAKNADVNTNPKGSLIDIAADLIGSSGIDLDTVVDLAASAVSGASKKSGGSKKKRVSKSDSIISKLIPEKKEYPQFSEKTYWAIREKFQKNIPEKVTASTLTNATGLKADTVKTTVLTALDTLGLTKDGKPTSKLKSWTNDAKYAETCQNICDAVYPDSLKKLGVETVAQQTSVLNWFKKNADASESTAKKMMKIYLLLAVPKLLSEAADKKAAASAKKPAAASKKSSGIESVLDSVKVTTTKKTGKATITVKIVADENISKKTLTDLFTSAAAEAYKQLK